MESSGTKGLIEQNSGASQAKALPADALQTRSEQALLRIVGSTPNPSLPKGVPLEATLLSQSPEGTAKILVAGQTLEVRLASNQALSNPITLTAIDESTLKLTASSITLESASAQASTREKLFLSALSGLEKLLLKKLLNSNEELSQKHAGEVQDYRGTNKSTDSGSFQQISRRLEALIGLSKGESSPGSSDALALKIITRLLGTENQTARADGKHVAILEKLIKTLANLEEDRPQATSSVLASSIKSQQHLNPQDRGTLIQGIVENSLEDKLLVENFLSRRSEIIDAKRDLLSVLTTLSRTNSAVSVTETVTTPSLDQLIPDFLKLVLSENSNKLQTIIKALPSDRDLKLLLLLVALEQSQTEVPLPATSAQNRLAIALRFDALVSRLIQVSEQGSDFSKYTALRQPDSLKSILESLLTSNSRLPNPDTSKLAVPTIQNQVFTPLSAKDILEQLSVSLKQLDPGISSLSQLESYSNRLSWQSGIRQELLLSMGISLKADQFINSQGSLARLSPEKLIEISLQSLQLALMSKAPELLRATSQLLTQALSDNDIVSVLNTLFLPLLKAGIISVEEEQSETASVLKQLLSQAEALQSPTNKSAPKRREALAALIEQALTKSSKETTNHESLNPAQLEQRLLEQIAKECFSRLNALAERSGQNHFNQVSLPPFNQLQLRTSSQLHGPEEDSEQQSNSRTKKQVERIECSMLLPQIGECGIELSIWENQISLSLKNTNQAVLSLAESLVPELINRMQSLDFEEPKVNLICDKPNEVKSEWLFELLGAQKQTS